MTERNGEIGFGFFRGMPYRIKEEEYEQFETYKNYKNKIPKEIIINHIETAAKHWATSLDARDIFTGEELKAGMYSDGKFVFPADFLHYLKNYDIGVPYEYEEYIAGILQEDHGKDS